jgi:hypothetical protein
MVKLDSENPKLDKRMVKLDIPSAAPDASRRTGGHCASVRVSLERHATHTCEVWTSATARCNQNQPPWSWPPSVGPIRSLELNPLVLTPEANRYPANAQTRNQRRMLA